MPGAALALSFEAIDHLRELMQPGLSICAKGQRGECALCDEIREAVA